MTREQKLAKLDELFGSYKAEWLKEKIFKFFAAPSYFNALKSPRPCVLQGGRGTGKTTVLRGLSYQGQYALNQNDIEKFDKNNYIGIYYRANTNHVHAFRGKGVNKEKWIDVFSHFFNLIITSEILYFLQWHKSVAKDDTVLQPHSCKLIATSLHIEDRVYDFDTLCKEVELAMFAFQADVNNISDSHMPKLSMPAEPIRIITEQTTLLQQFKGKTFYILIDEYENFLDEQQQTINGLLKHTPHSYTFKIGVREKGWRVKYTLNTLELLSDPADYVLFNIVETFTDVETSRLFDDFAKEVCQLRIKELMGGEVQTYNIDEALTNLSIEEESLLLGVATHKYYLDVVNYEKYHNIVLECSPLFKFFLSFWTETHGSILDTTINDFMINRKKWDDRYENYKYSMLFKIKKGRGSSGIQKYYDGWNTFVKLANGNIRYLMELVYRSYYLYLQDNGDILRPVPPDIQTKSAKNVGWKNLTELEGTWENGAQLTRMVQSLGTIFGKLAKSGDNLAPEIVQFELEGELSSRTTNILSAAVMNLALVRLPANKLSGRGSVKDFMYSLHPIFAPYFNYSYRRKRKMTMTEIEFLSCIDNPKDGVAMILNRKDINIDDESAMPEQLSLF